MRNGAVLDQIPYANIFADYICSLRPILVEEEPYAAMHLRLRTTTSTA